MILIKLAKIVCNILADKNVLYLIFSSAMILIVCICTLNPPNEINAVISIIFMISGIFKVLANFTPCVISNIPDVITFI